MALDPTQPSDGADAGRWFALDLVAGERLSVVLDGQLVLGHPHGDLHPGEALLGVEPVALEDQVAQAIDGARVAGQEERSLQVLLLKTRVLTQERTPAGDRLPALRCWWA